MQLPKHAHPIEREILQALVSGSINRGYDVTVWDGEEYAIKHSMSAEDALGAMSHTDEERLIFSDNECDHSYSGAAYIVYGNEPEYVIADYSAHEWLVKLAESITDKYEV